MLTFSELATQWNYGALLMIQIQFPIEKGTHNLIATQNPLYMKYANLCSE